MTVAGSGKNRTTIKSNKQRTMFLSEEARGEEVDIGRQIDSTLIPDTGSM